VASDFQRRKIGGVFGATDADVDGFLEASDFAAVTERWIGIRGWEVGSQESGRMDQIMMGWWSGLLALADENRDEKVSLDGVIVLDERRQVVEAWKGSDAGFDEVFPKLDLNSDGQLSRAEFRGLWSDFWRGDIRRPLGDGVGSSRAA
jgi:Ca2+-binding EF-hand superfamily protein